MTTRLTILFEDPYWAGIFEKEDEAGYFVAREIFGSEPTDLDVYQFILNRYNTLRYSSPRKDVVMRTKHFEDANPKRLQRLAAKEMKNRTGIKKAYEAISLEMEKLKKEKKVVSRQEREEESKKKFESRQMKKKEKHRGH